MACISDTSLWLHNKLGTSNDSWTSGSICSQLNKEVLRNIKDCFPDLQTQVKLKLLLSFFHIPRRLVEEWKNELEEIIEIAGLDSELWVSMIAETIKTFPNTGSLNTEISDYEETRPIFSELVNDLRKLINKHSDIGMLPLECQYLNKAALISVVGQQAPPVKHFTIKKKPKSAALKTELLQKCMDAQSIKKTSAPTIPLRSRGMPRKMTDTTPLKGIPSRVPSSGFRTPTSSQGQNRPNMSRTPAGRKDGGIKLLDIAEQPLGYAAAKKRKRQQELEDQQKRALEAASNPPVKQEPVPVTTTPDYAAGLTATTIYTTATQPATPASVIKEAPTNTTTASATNATPSTIQFVKTDVSKTDALAIKNEVIKVENTSTTTVFANQTENSSPSTNNNNQIVFTMKSPNSNKTSLSNSSPTIVSNVVNSIKQESPRIVVQQNQNSTLVTQQQQNAPTSTQSYITPPLAAYNQSNVTKQKINVQSVISSLPAVSSAMPTLTALSSNSSSIGQQHIITQSTQQPQQQQQQIQIPHQIGATKIVQIKTAPTIQMANAQRTTIQNIPPLIPTQQPTILNIRNVSIAGRQNQIQTTNASNISYITTTNSQHQQQPQQIQIQQQQIIQQQQQPQQQQIQVSNAPKYSQVVMSPNVKGGNTIILANPNVQTQKTFILRTIGADGKTTFQQVPLSNLTGLNLANNANNMTIVSNPPGLIKTSTTNQASSNQQQIPALVPTSSYTQNMQPVVITPANQQNIPQLINQQQSQQQQTIHIQQQPQQQGTTIIRQTMPQVLLTNQQGGVSMLPQGLTLIQRPGQQPQLVQTVQQQGGQQQQIHRTIITQPEQQQTMRQVQIRQIQPQQIQIIQQNQPTIITQQTPQPQQQQQQQPQQQQQQTQQIQPQQRIGLSLSHDHANKAHEMFRRANRVTRRDKALILSFMAGCRENPMPSADNCIVIKLSDSEEKVKTASNNSFSVMRVETFIKLDYNTGEWEKFQKFGRVEQTPQQIQQ